MAASPSSRNKWKDLDKIDRDLDHTTDHEKWHPSLIPQSKVHISSFISRINISPIDGWFREISSQWPGQAMTLKVNKILHVERSLYQDVLVFESETYGNVLVLDGAIQCTERDEFSFVACLPHCFTPESCFIKGTKK